MQVGLQINTRTVRVLISLIFTVINSIRADNKSLSRKFPEPKGNFW